MTDGDTVRAYSFPDECPECTWGLSIADTEWLKPGANRVTYRCECCEYELELTVGGVRTGFVDVESELEWVKGAYVDGRMSEGAMERSIERVLAYDD